MKLFGKYFLPADEEDEAILTLNKEQVDFIKNIDVQGKALDQTLDAAIRSHANNMIRINSDSNKFWDDIRDTIIASSPETRRSYDNQVVLLKERDDGEVIVTFKKV